MKKHLVLFILLGLVVLLSALPRNLVVVEIGTGTWCPYCPGAAMGADDLIANNHPVAIIENHNGDNYANTYSNARNSYYAITGYPTAVFDGLNPSVGGSSSQSMYSGYLTKVNARMSVASRYSISATGTLVGNTINIAAVVSKPEADTNTNVVLHCAITESHIMENWQGQNHLNFVNRLMLPNQNGTPVNLGTGEQQTINLTGNFNSAWNMNTSEVVLFVQNATTKEVLQGIKYTLPGLLGVNPVSATALDFPATYVGGMSSLPITIHNFFGTTITGNLSTNNSAFSLPQNTFTIAPYQTTNVNVYFSPTAAQAYSASLSISSNLPGFEQVSLPLSGSGFNNAAPTATNAVVTGPPVIFQDVTATYTFADADGNTEGASLFNWYRMINNTPQVIPGAILSTYNIQIEDLGWPIAYQVTPVDQHGMPGTPVMSAPTLAIEELPSPQNLAGSVAPPNTVVLTWQKPNHFDTRGFIGYRIFRNGSTLTNLMNINTLSYNDVNAPDGSHEYYVVAIYSNPLNFSNPSNTITVVVSVSNEDELSPSLQTISVYPNPFRSSGTWEIAGKANNPVKIEVFNLKGQHINTLSGKLDGTGTASIVWNATDLAGKPVNNGVYLYRLSSGNKTESGKIVVNR